jgi:tetratricopeptide (TPR) repeat protein
MKKQKFIIILVTFSLFILIASISYYFYSLRFKEYIVLGVPSINLFENGDRYWHIWALYSIFSYWKQFDSSLVQPSFEELAKHFLSVGKSEFSRKVGLLYIKDRSLENMLGYAKQIPNYEGKLIAANSVNDMRPFLRKHIPLIVLMRFSEGAPEFLLPAVVVGISRNDVIVHDYFRGPAYHMTVDRFEKLWEDTSGRKSFLALYPRYYKRILTQNIDKQYIRDPRYDRILPLIESYVEMFTYLHTGRVLLVGTDKGTNYIEAIKRGEAIISDPEFESLPKAWRVRVYGYLGFSYYGLSRAKGKDEASLRKALEYEEKAISLNSGLFDSSEFAAWPEAFVNASHGIFGDYNKANTGNPSKFSTPYLHLGWIYRALGEKEKAVEAYRMADAINPNPIAVYSLEAIDDDNFPPLCLLGLPGGDRTRSRTFCL